MILGIDSTGDMLSAGTVEGDDYIIQTAPGKPHSTTLLPLIDKLLGGKKPAAIAVATGPGSYTGTRIGVTTANMLGWAWNVPVYGISATGAGSMHALLARGKEKLAHGDRSSRALPQYP